MLCGVLAQMFDHGDHMGGWGWGWGILVMILVVAVVGLVVWLIIRTTQQASGHPHDRAREILAERLARGEITPDEYRELSNHL
jgi:putative membrane protein